MTETNNKHQRHPQKKGIAARRRILDCTLSLIGEVGLFRLKMSAVAEVAEMSMGSLYQYYSGKTELIMALVEREFDIITKHQRNLLEQCTSLADVKEALREHLFFFRDQVVSQKSLMLLWNGLRADADLKRLDIEDTHRNAALLAATIARFTDVKDQVLLEKLAFLTLEIGSTIAKHSVDHHHSDNDKILDAVLESHWSFLTQSIQ